MYPKCYGSTTGSNPVSVGSTPTGYANYGDWSVDGYMLACEAEVAGSLPVDHPRFILLGPWR